MNRTSIWVTAGILAAGVALGSLILSGGKLSMHDDGHDDHGEHAHGKGSPGHAKDAMGKGPRGGRLLSKGDFALEVTIFERGVPPEFRVFARGGGRAVDPAEVTLQFVLERLGAPPETIRFRRDGDFLRGDQVVKEPHSFKVAVEAGYQGQTYSWAYEQAEGRVKMDDTRAKSSGIELRTAGPARIRSVLQLQGEIQLNRDRVAHVVPRMQGVVVRVTKNLGDPVRKGDVLAVIESQTLADLKSEHLAARSRLELARGNLEREKRLWEEKISAQQDYLASRQAALEAEIAHRNVEQKLLALGLTHDAVMRNSGAEGLTRYEVRSPIDGIVTEKNLAAGEAVKEDANVFTIADLSTVWAEMTIYPKDLASVKLGQKVTVRAGALNAQAEGRVAYVGALVGEQTRSAKARVLLQNPERSWRPGLFVTVDLVQDESEVPVAVAVEAIQALRDWKVVFGRFGDVFEARPVELGRSDGKTVEVLSGLAPGTRYAASNSFVLKADLGKAGASHDH